LYEYRYSIIIQFNVYKVLEHPTQPYLPNGRRAGPTGEGVINDLFSLGEIRKGVNKI
jgi:hypothetical protein